MNKNYLLLVQLFILQSIFSFNAFAKEYTVTNNSENFESISFWNNDETISTTYNKNTSFEKFSIRKLGHVINPALDAYFETEINTLNPDGFTAIWNTELISNGSSGINQIEIPTNPVFTYNYTVDWGDGQTDTNVTGNITHTYTTTGLKTVCISGDFPAIYFNADGDRLKIIEILQWGDIQWQSMESAFQGCENLNFDAIDNPDLSQTTSLKNMFRDATLFNGIINNWNISTITDISGMFFDAEAFNRPLDNWDVRNVTDMSETFESTDLFNEPLDSWNTGSVVTMASMFARASSFNQDISSWNVSNVTDMSEMFSSTRYNFPLSSWDVSNVTTMSSMFSSSDFNLPIENWDVSNVTDMSSMFAQSEFNQPLDGWDVSNVTDMEEMFYRHRTFDQPINSWDVSNVTSMAGMFDGWIWGGVFNQPLDAWDVSNVPDMSFMFRDNRFFNQPLDTWDVSNVTNMEGFFDHTLSFNQNIDNWDVSNVTNMSLMFDGAQSFNEPLNSWNVSSVVEMNGIFRDAFAFDQPLNNWDVSSVINFASAFQDTSTIENTIFNQDITGWDTSAATNMSSMFSNASVFNHNLSSWNITNVSNMTNMLSNSGLSQENYDAILIGWSTQMVTDNIYLGAVNLNYCDGREERQSLIDDHNWTFTGDIVNCSFVLCTEITSPQDGDTNVPANSDIRWAPAPNATGYRVTLEVERGGVRDFVIFNGNIANNLDVGNVVGLDFTNEFAPGDIVYVTVTPYNDEGPATSCEEISFTVIESWVNSPDAFKLTYDTTENGNTPINQLEIETTNGLTYDFSIDWGDGQYNHNVSDDIIHTYLVPGIYTVSIINTYPAPSHSEASSDSNKLLSIDQWGTQEWQSMVSAFAGCSNMVYNTTEIPNLNNVTNMSSMFVACDAFNGNINNWDVSNVTNMSRMFAAADTFNQPIDNWDVSNVTTMSLMFFGMETFNQNINNWDTANVIDMSRMFESTEAFNTPLNDWDVSNVTNMNRMFKRADAFNQPIGNWDVSAVTTMEEMFNQALVFNQNIDSWDVGSVTTMKNMFNGASSFNSPLNSWDVSNVITTEFMFQSAIAFDQPLENWDVISVTSMQSMFQSASAFNQSLNSWNVSNVTTMRSMFSGATVFDSVLNNWNVDSVVDMSFMFAFATAFNQPLNNWNVSAVSNMSSMFESAETFNQDLNNWDVSSVTLMSSMFENTIAFNQPLNNWDVGNVTLMNLMFKNASIFDQPLENWDTGEVLNTSEMFSGASVFNQLIDSWDVSFVTTMESMFENAITYNQTMNSWNTTSVLTMEDMFNGATVFNGNISNWNVRNVNTTERMFQNAITYNQPMNEWRVNGITNMQSMFRGATSFNRPLNQWNIGSVTMASMLSDASTFNQSLEEWDVSNVSNMTNMLDNTALTRMNYDNTLIAWSELNLTPGITLGALGLPYCEAIEERQSMIDNFGWTFSLDELDCPIPLCTQLVAPINGAIDVPANTNITWDPVLYAIGGYSVTVRVEPSGTLILDNEVVTETTYEFPTDFNPGDTVFITIIPFNFNGEPTGCSEESFVITNDTTPVIPECTTLSLPINNTVDVSVATNIEWLAIENADGYRIDIGTTPGGTDIINNQDVGNETTFDIPNDLPDNVIIYVNITPYNEVGDATGCIEETFTTELIPVIPDCTMLSLPLNGAIDVNIDTDITWDIVTNATGYLITIGTNSGSGNIINSQDVGNVTTFILPENLPEARTIYVTIIPYNDLGDATGCIEESFITIDTSVPPMAPVCTSLTSPIDGAINIALDTNITWNAIGDATGYFLTVGTTSGGNNIINNQDLGDVTTFDFPNDFEPNQTVFVTIIPYNDIGSATGCLEESFTTETIPDCTTLSNPLNSATEVTLDTDLTWNAIANATGYFLTVGTTTGGNNIIDNQDVGNVTTFDLPNDLDGNATIFVTIIPYNNAGSAMGCTEESFNTETSPDCTSLASPLNGDTGVALDTDLTWNTITNATGYFLTVGTTVGGNDIINNQDVGNVTTFDLPNDLDGNATIFVTIIPYNNAGSAMGCTEESFNTETSPDCTSLASPLNGDTGVALDTNLTWNAITNATGYFLTVGTNAGGNDIIDNQDVGNVTTFDLPNDFNEDSIIFITVTPYNAAGNAMGCAEESFTTETIPDCTSLLNPINTTVGVIISTGLIWNSVNNATGYILSVGTNTGGNDIIDNLDLGNVTTYNFPDDLEENTTIFVTITPYNAIGNAIGCSEESFTTEIISTIPSCTNLLDPLDGSINVAVDTDIIWDAIDNATGYILTIGTTSGGSDITNNQDVGDDTSFILNEALPENTTIFVTIIPYNELGTAEGCSEESFTTEIIENNTKFGFSPDGDGINEFWEIHKIEDYPNNVVSIFNRWGDIVFRIKGYDNNQNVFRGDANQLTKIGAGRLPEGTYFFQIDIPEENNLNLSKGFLVIKR